MSIQFFNQSVDFSLHNPDNLCRWIAEVAKRGGMAVGRISYLFCDDEYILEANRKYLSHDTYTDIITFDYVVGSTLSGDILISLDRVGENARKFEVDFGHELLRVVIHGVLHLMGQGDKSETEAQEMRRREGEALELWQTMFHGEQPC